LFIPLHFDRLRQIAANLVSRLLTEMLEVRILPREPTPLSRNALTADGSKLPFDDNEFDFVATHMVTHHIPDWQNALHQMLRVLKPNGHLLYKDFALPKWVASLGKKISKSLGYLTPEDLNRFAEENHLAVVYLARSFNKYEAVWRKPV